MTLKSENQMSVPHIGNLINDFIQQKRKSPSVLSRKLDLSVNNVLKIRKKETIQIKLLWEISQVYQHNFIADIAMQMPEHFTGALQNAMIEKEKEMNALKSALEAVIKERELLKELFKK